MLLSLRARDAGDRAKTFALVFLTAPKSAEWVYVYEPSSCAFRRTDDDLQSAMERYVGVACLWAGDFLAVSRGEVEPRNIFRATQEDWALDGIDGEPMRPITQQIWFFYHPQRFPERTLQQYRRALELERGAAQPLRLRASPYA
jgi:hypothetical protein